MSAPAGSAQAQSADGIQDSMASLRAKVEGDRAFERLYRKHVTDVYRYALALVRSEADAEDVTQTTFLNAFRAYQRGERPRKSKSWLLAIAHNVCRQRFRHQARRPQEVELDEDLAEAAVPEEGPTADDLVRALQHLSFNQRAALVMRELEGRSYAEIGEILELPVSAVETLLFRARRALREQLESSISCAEAERLLSLQLDGRLVRTDRGALRAHLRSCPDCARAARSQRAQRAAWRSLAVIPLPGSLTSLFGGGGTAAVGVGTGLAVKAAALGATVALVGGGTYAGVRYTESKTTHKPLRAAVAPARAKHRPAASPRPVASRSAPAPAPAARRHRTEPKGKAKAKPTTGHHKRGIGRGLVGTAAQTTPPGREGQDARSHGYSSRHAVPRRSAVPLRKQTTPVTRSAKHHPATVRKRSRKKAKTKAKVETRVKKAKHSTSHSSTAAPKSESSTNGPRKLRGDEQPVLTPTSDAGKSASPDHPSKR